MRLPGYWRPAGLREPLIGSYLRSADETLLVLPNEDERIYELQPIKWTPKHPAILESALWMAVLSWFLPFKAFCFDAERYFWYISAPHAFEKY